MPISTGRESCIWSKIRREVTYMSRLERSDFIIRCLMYLAQEDGISYRAAQKKYDTQVIELVDSINN